MQKLLFYRDYSHLDEYYTLSQQWLKYLNIKTVPHWTFKKTLEMYNHKHRDEYLTFRFNIFHEWYIKQEKTSPIFAGQVSRYLDALYLKPFLNAYEKNFVLEIKSHQFTLDRNLKSLIIDFDLEKEEAVFFHYRKVNFYNSELEPIENADLYFTTHRVVLTSFNDEFSFYLDEITAFKFNEKTFSLFYHGHKFIFSYEKIDLIQVSLQRLYKELKKEFKYESKN